MRWPFKVAFLFTLLVVAGWWFVSVSPVCWTPIPYRVGLIDGRFNLTLEEARAATEEAVMVWEQGTARDLFVYEETAALSVNFVFDERQAKAEAEAELRERLNASENINSAIGKTYEELVERYDELEARYKTKKDSYETRLADYNAEVAEYNETGGAPAAEFRRLQGVQGQLEQEQGELNRLAGELNNLAKEINSLGEKGNRLIETYNEGVEKYNEAFSEGEEFTQGDYTGKSINIYTFKDRSELVLVLAHEFGHALSVPHVEGEMSVMHYFMGEQDLETGLTTEDLAGFEAMCGAAEAWTTKLFKRFW